MFAILDSHEVNEGAVFKKTVELLHHSGSLFFKQIIRIQEFDWFEYIENEAQKYGYQLIFISNREGFYLSETKMRQYILNKNSDPLEINTSLVIAA